MSDPPEHLTSALSDRYAIEREIGRGGMAVVYLAEDLKHGRKVAVKVLGSEVSAAVGADRFQREIEIAARLNHPNILTLIDSGQAGDLLYYVMPYVEGDSLRDRLAQGPLPVAEAVQIVREVGAALTYAHDGGIVHRDIKPENILFHGDQAVITDFGIARAVTVAGGEKLTQTGIAVGTPAYMSPEQGSGSETIDARSDIYSLGSVLYEMLVGEPPYTGRNARAILARKMVEPVSSIRTVRETVPLGLETAVTVALAKEPADRFTTAEEFIEALDQAGTVATPVSSTIASPWASPRRIAVAIPLLITLVGAAWWFGGGPAASGDSVQRMIVMPFDNLTADSAQEITLAVLYEGLRSELQRLQGLTVLSEQTARFDKSRNVPLSDISRERDLDLVVVGSLTPVGDSLRLKLELLEGSEERELWSGEYHSVLDSAVLLSAFTRSIVTAMAQDGDFNLTPEERQHLVRARNIEPAVQALYNEARHQILNRDNVERGIALLVQATQQDPDFAEAHSLLASSYITSVYVPPFYSTHEAYPKAKEAARTAIVLDQAVGAAHGELGWSLFMYDWDPAGALEEVERGYSIDPNSERSSFYYSMVLSMLGRHDDALAVARRAAEMEPWNVPSVNHVGTTLFLARRFDEAIDQFKRALELKDDNPFTHQWLPIAYSHAGRHAEAVAAALSAASTSPHLRSQLAYVLARAGQTAEATELAAELLAEAEQNAPLFWSGLATISGALGDLDQAFELLDRAADARDGGLPLAGASPAFDELRSDARFDSLLERLNLATP